jgi:anti-sigma factor RsiW
MRYLDGELPPDERRRVEDAVSGSEELRRQLEAFRALRTDLHGLRFAESSCEGTVWHRVAAQVTRPAGRTFALVGLVAWLAYAAWALSSGTPDPWDRIAVAGVSIGVLVLLAAVIRDRFRSWSDDA